METQAGKAAKRRLPALKIDCPPAPETNAPALTPEGAGVSFMQMPEGAASRLFRPTLTAPK